MGWLLVSAFIVEALDESRFRGVGTYVLALALASGEPVAPFAGVSMLQEGRGRGKKKVISSCGKAFERGSLQQAGGGQEWRTRLDCCGGVSTSW